MSQKSVGIIGTGLYVPDEIRTNDWFNKLSPRSLDRIFDQAGVKERRVCAQNELASDMEAKALLAAVENAGISIGDVEMMFAGSTLNDQPQPGNASALHHKVGANKNTGSMNVETACASLLSQITVAYSMIAAGLYKTVACVVSVNWTKTADLTDRSCMFMGDGAAAVIMQPVSAGKGILGIHLETHGQHHLGVGINFRLPRAYIEEYQAADYLHGGREQMYFYMDKNHEGFREIGAAGPTIMPEISKKALAKAGYTTADIDFFIPHNPSKILTNAWREGLGVAPEKMHTTIEKYGNMSAASIGANLHECNIYNKLKDGDLVVMCAPGAGYQYAAVVLRWGK